MESIAKEFAEADGSKCVGFKMRQLDNFGSMYGFHVRGSNNYQTKVGAIFTIIYLVLVMATFGFYLSKMTDMSKPFVMWNQYKDQEYPEIDLWKENFHFYFLPLNTGKVDYHLWDQFWGSFHIYASIFDQSLHRMGTHDNWDRIPMQKCSEQDWAKALPNDIDRKYILQSGICLNPLKMVKSPLSRFKETFPISGGKLAGSKRLELDIYKCIPGGALPTTGVPTTCDYSVADSEIQMYIYEKTVNVKYYEKPIESTHVRFDHLIPSTNLRYSAEMHIKWLDLYTDIGNVAKNWKLDQVPTVQTNIKEIGDWSLTHIATNFLSQGKLIMTDMQYHLEISTSNEKTEIWRSYFSIIDVFSAVGGI
jgi:hypothetical protein